MFVCLVQYQIDIYLTCLKLCYLTTFYLIFVLNENHLQIILQVIFIASLIQRDNVNKFEKILMLYLSQNSKFGSIHEQELKNKKCLILLLLRHNRKKRFNLVYRFYRFQPICGCLQSRKMQWEVLVQEHCLHHSFQEAEDDGKTQGGTEPQGPASLDRAYLLTEGPLIPSLSKGPTYEHISYMQNLLPKKRNSGWVLREERVIKTEAKEIMLLQSAGHQGLRYSSPLQIFPVFAVYFPTQYSLCIIR